MAKDFKCNIDPSGSSSVTIAGTDNVSAQLMLRGFHRGFWNRLTTTNIFYPPRRLFNVELLPATGLSHVDPPGPTYTVTIDFTGAEPNFVTVFNDLTAARKFVERAAHIGVWVSATRFIPGEVFNLGLVT